MLPACSLSQLSVESGERVAQEWGGYRWQQAEQPLAMDMHFTAVQ